MPGILPGDPITRLAFSVAENKGVFALLLGSGLSRSAQIPTGWDIIVDLIRRVATARGIDDQADWAAWYESTTGEPPSYSSLLQELGSTPAERRSIIHPYIEPNDDDRANGRKLPTAAHRAIAELVRAGFIKVIITTNFDRLVQSALRQVGVEPTVVSSPDGFRGAVPLGHASAYVLKLHGDYQDDRMLNTSEELERYAPEFDRALDRIFDEYGLVVSGWSGDWDTALRSALLRAPNRRYPVFWTHVSDLSAAAADMISARGATAIHIESADRFFSDLSSKVSAIDRERRPNPSSVGLLLAQLKQGLTRPEQRVANHDLLDNEMSRTLDQLEPVNFSANADFDTDHFGPKVDAIESLVEPIGKALGLVGRWGELSTHRDTTNIIQAVYRRSSAPIAGTNNRVYLRTLPAVLLVYAYGLGLTAAERWKALHDFLRSPLSAAQRNHRDIQPTVVDKLFLWNWDGDDKALWHRYPGLERHHTPLSDHLFGLFQRWGGDFLGAATDLELCFERFELLAYLAAADSQADSDIDGVRDSQDVRNALPIPIGRSAWNTRVRDTLVREFEDVDGYRRELLAAGFARGSEDRLTTLVNINLPRVARYTAPPF